MRNEDADGDFPRPAGQIRDIVENSVIALFKRPTCPLCGACRNIYSFGSKLFIRTGVNMNI